MDGFLECCVINCDRQPIWGDGDDILCERHMPDPHTRSWAEMKAEGIEIETMAEYAAELRYVPDYDPGDPYDDYDAEGW